MSHREQLEFVKTVSQCLEHYFRNSRVLEIGSLNINGSVRQYFENCDYVGIDIGPGKDVDLVCEGQKYDAPDETYDQVISCEVMEHNPYWIETFENMWRLCKPGGLVLMTCATTGRAEHGTTRTSPENSPITVNQGWDYYRNLKGTDFSAKCKLNKKFDNYRFWVNWQSFDLYFIGVKRRSIPEPLFQQQWDRAVETLDSGMRKTIGKKRRFYRSLAARVGGDHYFELMRRIGKRLTDLHGG